MATSRTKKLIVCCDGTWDNSDSGYVRDSLFDNGHLQAASNVTRIGRAVLPEDANGSQQIVYYQAGIGSNSSISFTDHLTAGVTGRGLSENIREAYSFLVNNYEASDGVPDEIFLLGFSRGAFTARSIGGMIGGIGLLTKKGMEHFYEIFSDYENAGNKRYAPKLPKVLQSFKLPSEAKPSDVKPYLSAYINALWDLGLTRVVRITAIGVWDTVGALGVPVIPVFQQLFGRAAFQEYQFYDTSLDNHIDYAFQALALDETRSTFVPAVWERPEGCTTIAKQVYFCGAHSDVGGGYGNLEISAQDITLAWMMSNLSPWIEFDSSYLPDQILQRQGLSIPPFRWGCGEIHNSNTGFWRVAGSTSRTPDLYHRTNYETGLYTKERLQDTNEMVHASVRARVEHGGPGPNGVAKYDTKFTRNWRYNGVWEYIGKDEEGQGKVMQEDELGIFELQLLDLVDPAAKILYLEHHEKRVTQDQLPAQSL